MGLMSASTQHAFLRDPPVVPHGFAPAADEVESKRLGRRRIGPEDARADPRADRFAINAQSLRLGAVALAT
jgi:hypothetical protein